MCANVLQGTDLIRVSRFYKDSKEGKFVSYIHDDTRTLYDGFRKGAKESSKSLSKTDSIATTRTQASLCLSLSFLFLVLNKRAESAARGRVMDRLASGEPSRARKSHDKRATRSPSTNKLEDFCYPRG